MCNKNFIHTCCTIKTICQINNEQAPIAFVEIIKLKALLTTSVFGRGVTSKGILLRIHNTGIFFGKRKVEKENGFFFLITIAFSLHIFICMIFFQSYACTSVSPYTATTVEVFTEEWLRK